MIEKIRQNKEDKHSGKVKHIPCTIDRFNQFFHGIVKADYLCFTGGSSSGKTTLMKKVTVFDAIEYAILTGLNLKIKYFGLEESEEQFDYSLLSYLLRKRYSLRYNIIDFNYINDGILPEHEQYIEEIQEEFELWKSYIIYYDHIYNPYGIYKTIRDFAQSRGQFFFKGNPVENEESWDSYVPDDPEEFIIVIVDHVSLLLPEQKHNNKLDEAMKDMSFYLRNYVSKKFGYTSVAVQQQMGEQEDLEHIKNGRWMPTLQGFGDNKRLGRDYLTVIGIGNPNRYNVKTYDKYINLEDYNGFLRFISILKQRYGVVDKVMGVFFDGKCGYIKAAPKPDDTPSMRAMLDKIKEYL